MNRLEREAGTVERMIGLYCRAVHGGKERCGECRELARYAKERIGKCPFGDRKPACKNCSIHCYRPEMRTRIREVMRFAGPKMIRRHPFLAICHLLERFDRGAGRQEKKP